MKESTKHIHMIVMVVILSVMSYIVVNDFFDFIGVGRPHGLISGLIYFCLVAGWHVEVKSWIWKK